MSYISIDQVKSRIPWRDLVDALDDDGDGVIDEDVWAEIQADADNSVDAILGQRFEVPFTDPVPALIIEAARIFCLELIFIRRGYHTDEQNPWAKSAREVRAKLSRIASSDEPLQPTKKGSGKVRIISEPSRTQSSGGYFAT